MTTSKFPIVVAIIAASAFAYKKYNEWDTHILSTREVTNLFAGKTVEGRQIMKDYNFISYYENNNTFRSYQNGSNQPKHGDWWVEKNGDICIRWQQTNREHCRTMIKDKLGHYKKIEVGIFGQKELIVRFDKFEQGNMHNL